MLSEDELLEIDEDGESDAKRVKLSLQDNLEKTDSSEGKYPKLTKENMFIIADIIDEKNGSEISNDNPLEINYTAEETECFFGQRPFTKNQMRKWLKKEKWEARKNEKRAKEKAKAKLKRFEAKVNNIDIGPSRKALKHSKVANSSCTSGMVIDLSFDNLMIEKDRAKVIKQILRCYSLNRRSPSPMNFTVCSFGPRTKKEMARHNGYEYWDVKFEENGYLDVFAKEQLVYLSSESENVIEAVEPNKMYIIGGLVDHNAHKGLCHKIAVEQGIQHARLPIDKYLNMKSRKVLTIDHVFEILLRVSEGKTWPEALMQVVPMRKGATSVAGKKSSQTSEADDTLLDEDSPSPDSEEDDAKEASGAIDRGSSQNSPVAAVDGSEPAEGCLSLKSDASTTKCDNEVQS